MAPTDDISTPRFAKRSGSGVIQVDLVNPAIDEEVAVTLETNQR